MALLRTLVLLALVVAPSFAQSREARSALASARTALERGEHDAARSHAERAAASPAPDERAEAARISAAASRALGDRAAVVRAALLWAEAAAGADGRARATAQDVEAFRVGELDAATLALELTAARVALADALVEAAADRQRAGGRTPVALLTASWLRRAAADLLTGLPRAHDARKGALDPAVHVPSNAHGPVLKRLERMVKAALTAGRAGRALEIARVIKGLGVQADFKDLEGPRPAGMAKWRARGAELVDDARERARRGEERPWTVEELEWLATAEGEAFTRTHDTFAAPGVAVSPRGWYRIESDCGYEALLAAASTIEGHHERLAKWFGEDPFNGDEPRQGLVRIVPDPSGLEAEGAPFFWVGGFQSGDVTVLRLSVGTVEGLGRGLVHELTHRFDGALHRGIPAWLAEGRAVWTGAAYGPVDAPAFHRAFAAGGTLYGVLAGGDAGRANLEKVVSGEPEDYRDNYTVGTALYTFLATWFPGDAKRLDAGTPIFADRLRAFEDAGDHEARPRKRFERFERTFCDGVEGRPDGFDAFVEEFRTFLAGFDPREPAPFRSRYGGVKGGESTWIYDEPTWTWDWVRAEPRFGQGLALRAGELLLQDGALSEALRALVWARATDGYDARTGTRLAAALGAVKRPSELEREALGVVAREGAGAPIGELADGHPPAQLPAYAAYDGRLAAAAAALEEQGLDGVAVALSAERARLRGWLGDSGANAAVDARGTRPVQRSFELSGWTDAALAGFDRDRPEGLFRIEEDGGLLLGRRKARSTSGRIDRGGGGTSFVLADEWIAPGVWEVSTRVRFTTGYNTFVCVIGYREREQNVRFFLNAGDVDFVIGETDEEPEFRSIGWRFDGRRTRDGGLPGSARGGAYDVGRRTTAVDLTLRVEGAAVEAWIDGEFVGVYHAVDGHPIAGRIGFGTRSGAVHVAAPVVRRDTVARRRVLDLASGIGPDFESLANTTFASDGAAVPPNGALVLWIPSWSKAEPEQGKREDVDARLGRAEHAVRDLVERTWRADVVQPLYVAVHADRLDSEEGREFAAHLAEEHGEAVRVVPHRVDRPSEGETTIDGGRRWILFVDGYHVVRAAHPWYRADVLDDGPLAHWLTVFRDHGRPDRDLPAPTRAADEGADGEDGQ